MELEAGTVHMSQVSGEEQGLHDRRLMSVWDPDFSISGKKWPLSKILAWTKEPEF